MSKMVGKAMQDDMKSYQDSLEDMNNQAVEYVRGMPVVKTFGQSVYTFKNLRVLLIIMIIFVYHTLKKQESLCYNFKLL